MAQLSSGASQHPKREEMETQHMLLLDQEGKEKGGCAHAGVKSTWEQPGEHLALLWMLNGKISGFHEEHLKGDAQGRREAQPC